MMVSTVTDEVLRDISIALSNQNPTAFNIHGIQLCNILLRSLQFKNTLYGYGDAFTANWYFIGMEEGGGHDLLDHVKRLLAWNYFRNLHAYPPVVSNMPPNNTPHYCFVDLHKYHEWASLGANWLNPGGPLQNTWASLIRILESQIDQAGWAAMPPADQRNAIQTYQANNLARIPIMPVPLPNTCIFELLPLSSPGNNPDPWLPQEWNIWGSKRDYERDLVGPLLPIRNEELKDVPALIQRINNAGEGVPVPGGAGGAGGGAPVPGSLPPRMNLIIQFMNHVIANNHAGRPLRFIFYGKGYWGYYLQIAIAVLGPAAVWAHFNFNGFDMLRGNANNITIGMIEHPNARGITNQYFDDVGQNI